MSSEWPSLTLRQAGVALIDCDHRTPAAAKEGYPYIAIPQLKNGRISLDGVRRISQPDYLEWTRKLKPQAHDVIVVRRCNSGQSAHVPEGLACAIGQNLVVLRADGKVVRPEFLRWLVSGPDWWDQVGKFINVGAVFDSLRCKDIPNFELRIPPLNTQREIAATLRAIDDRITLLRETNATLEAIAQALFKSWFVDFDPVRAKRDGRAPEGMDEATAARFPDSFEDSELGKVPRGWSYCSLKEVTRIFDSIRIPLSGADREKRRGQYPYYGAAALMDHVDDFLFDGVYLLTGEDGSVADANGFPITQYVWGKFWVNNHAHVMQGANGVSTEHLMLALKQTNIQPYITGAVQAKLSQSNMWRIQFLQSSSEVTAAFSSRIAPLFASFRHNADRAQTLSSLRDTLLPRLISGQLRLPEPHSLLEATA
ncbi:restriction endonuclease subunit S [Roseateles chitinivorans]|uniref:restriction endonuclease subunit S n=1 Tax=Roseateles chitinivorans TaxID=2917965 RepID=UPI003D67AFC4